MCVCVCGGGVCVCVDECVFYQRVYKGQGLSAIHPLQSYGKFLYTSVWGVWWVGYLKCVGKSSLVEMTSRAFQPNIATPLNTQDKTTVTFSVGGTMRIRKALNPHTNTDRANGGGGGYKCEV